MKTLTLASLVALAAAPVFAESHLSEAAAAGEELFNRQCVTCHVIANGDEVLAGRNAKTGPNLFGIVGGPVAHAEDFSYGDSILAAKEAGITWDEAALATYMQDPTAWLREVTGDARGRSKMSFKVRKEEDAAAIAAFIASFSAE